MLASAILVALRLALICDAALALLQLALSRRALAHHALLLALA